MAFWLKTQGHERLSPIPPSLQTAQERSAFDWRKVLPPWTIRDNTTILTTNSGVSGAWAEGSNSTLDITGSRITTQSNVAYGVRAGLGSAITVTNSAITTTVLTPWPDF